MPDEMLRRSEFLEYMKTFEERLTTRFDQRMDHFEQGQDRLEQRQGGLEQGQGRLEQRQTALERGQGRLEQRQTALEQGQGRLEQRQGGLAQGQDRLEQRQTAFEQGQDRLEQRQGGIEEGQSRLAQRMDIQFDETRSLIRLSLEGIGALRETTERGFADVRSDIYQNKTLLEAALKHVRRRVERVENNRGGER